MAAAIIVVVVIVVIVVVILSLAYIAKEVNQSTAVQTPVAKSLSGNYFNRTATDGPVRNLTGGHVLIKTNETGKAPAKMMGTVSSNSTKQRTTTIRSIKVQICALFCFCLCKTHCGPE